jgi:hypothetical protein
LRLGWGVGVLQILSEKVALCHRHACEARARAQRATDQAEKRDYLALERRWLLLAESYQFTERVGDFNEEVKRRPIASTPPMPRVMCPECGRRMRLAKIEPVIEPYYAEATTYDCRCGHVLTHTIPVRPSRVNPEEGRGA